MLKIAMISYHTCPLATLGGKDTGGMNVYVRELSIELGRRGIHVDIFTRSQDEHVPHVLHELGYGNRIVHVPAGPEHPLPKSELLDYIPEFVEGIKNFAAQKNIQYDIIHSHYWLSGLAAELLREEWQVPIVQMFHTLGELKNRIAKSVDEYEGTYRLDNERRVMATVDKIIAATPIEKEQLKEFYLADERKITVIPPGVNLDHFYPIDTDEARDVIGIPKRDMVFLYVGRIEPLKGIDTLLRALACMNSKREVDHASLIVIGGNPNDTPEKMGAEMVRLQTLCSDLCLNRTVLFLGKKDQAYLHYYYSAADALVMPSHYESFGMVALEAMACGTPVIASNVGGLSFLIKEGITGFHVPNGDPEALCRKLSMIEYDDLLRIKIGQQASEYATEYSWKRIADRMVRVYKEVSIEPDYLSTLRT
ncbi:MAG TPA: glycosyltransferase [Anaerolineales bacterium]|nr:glycosyltransferase [Anaerolineales bacterium]